MFVAYYLHIAIIEINWLFNFLLQQQNVRKKIFIIVYWMKSINKRENSNYVVERCYIRRMIMQDGYISFQKHWNAFERDSCDGFWMGNKVRDYRVVARFFTFDTVSTHESEVELNSVCALIGAFIHFSLMAAHWKNLFHAMCQRNWTWMVCRNVRIPNTTRTWHNLYSTLYNAVCRRGFRYLLPSVHALISRKLANVVSQSFQLIILRNNIFSFPFISNRLFLWFEEMIHLHHF